MKNNNPSKGTALITGASSGIGATYADRLARRGYDLILVARDQQRLESLAQTLQRETGAGADVLKADLTNKQELAKVEARLRSDAHITMLVNNAGIAVVGKWASADADRLDSMINLNVSVPTRLIAAAVPAFVARGQGTIINIASVTALAPERYSGSYSGTKAYLLNLTQNLHEEVTGKGVQVQAVLPGATRTAIWEKAGVDLAQLPANTVMDLDEMVDAALAGLDQGELVTIPSLPDAEDWKAFTEARLKLGPNLSRDHSAARYEYR